jgi:biotin carboxyl carrier protein
MYVAKVNDELEVTVVKKSEAEYTLDGKNVELDLLQIANNRYHILLNNKSYTVETVGFDQEQKTGKILVNNRLYEVKLKDETDLLLEKYGVETQGKKTINEIKSPMPGLVIKVIVEPGNAIDKGQPLLVLESMKMENVIKAQGNGIIDTVHCKVGDTVEKNQLLIKLA